MEGVLSLYILLLIVLEHGQGKLQPFKFFLFCFILFVFLKISAPSISRNAKGVMERMYHLQDREHFAYNY